MNKIRIMHVLNTDSYSGAENVAISIIEGTSSKCDSIYVSLDGSIRDILKEKGITFYPITKMTVYEIANAIKILHPDVIHAHDFTAGIICSMVTTSVTIINHIHNNSPWLKKYGLYSFAYLTASFQFKKILTVSPSVMNEYVFGKKLSKKTIVIGNPINTEKIRKLAGDLPAVSQYDIAFLGRLSEEKNPFLFLEIADAVRREIPELKCIMIGDGELRNEVNACIKAKNLDGCITMMGFQKNPYVYLKLAKICCMPSKWEGFGLAAVEALSLGIPVVAAPVGGLVTIINKSCGFFCKDVSDYSDKIVKMLKKAELYQRLSAGALVRANQMENIKAYCNKMIDCYYQSLNNR